MRFDFWRRHALCVCVYVCVCEGACVCLGGVWMWGVWGKLGIHITYVHIHVKILFRLDTVLLFEFYSYLHYIIFAFIQYYLGVIDVKSNESSGYWIINTLFL